MNIRTVYLWFSNDCIYFILYFPTFQSESSIAVGIIGSIFPHIDSQSLLTVENEGVIVVRGLNIHRR